MRLLQRLVILVLRNTGEWFVVRISGFVWCNSGCKTRYTWMTSRPVNKESCVILLNNRCVLVFIQVNYAIARRFVLAKISVRRCMWSLFFFSESKWQPFFSLGWRWDGDECMWCLKAPLVFTGFFCVGYSERLSLCIFLIYLRRIINRFLW